MATEAEVADKNAFFLKTTLYIFGTLLGLAANLSSIRMKRELTLREILFNTSVAFASAWLVWFICDHYHMGDWAIGFSVIVGRFGDAILIGAGKAVKKTILSMININE